MSTSQQDRKERIDVKVLVAILAAGVIFQVYNTYYVVDEKDNLDAIEISVKASVVMVAILAFIVAKRYWGSEVFGRAYLSLAIGYTLFAIGDGIWDYYEIFTEMPPYPSIADIFYYGYYPFTIYHLTKNSFYFKRKITTPTKIWLALIPISIVGIFTYLLILNAEEFSEFDYFYGVLFVSGTSVTLAFALLGAYVFRSSVLGTAWLLLAGGIFLNSLADVWYYYLEYFGEYTDRHVVMMLWFLASLFIAYALYKHKKVI